MRLINDPNLGSSSKEPINLALLPFYTFFCAVGFSTFVFSPLSLILVHRRLPDFWPKIVSILGAVLALILFDVPPAALLVSFVLGVFVADSIQRNVPVWKLLIQSGFLVLGLGLVGAVGFSIFLKHSNPWVLWVELVDKILVQAQQSPIISGDWDWKITRDLLVYQGPFYFVSGNLLTVWLSIGLSAHLKWFPESEPYSAQSLRKLKLPRFLGPIVLASWAGSLFLPNPAKFVVSGFLNWGLVFLSFQGLVVLSSVMEPKKWANWVRTLIYLGFIFVGFYVLVGLGLISSNILTKRKGLLDTPLEEPVDTKSEALEEKT